MTGTDLFLVAEGQNCCVPTLACAHAHLDAVTAMTRERRRFDPLPGG